MPYAEASAALIRAGLLAARGDLAGAVTRLADAADRFDAADMRLGAEAARRRLGLLARRRRGPRPGRPGRLLDGR